MTIDTGNDNLWQFIEMLCANRRKEVAELREQLEAARSGVRGTVPFKGGQISNALAIKRERDEALAQLAKLKNPHYRSGIILEVRDALLGHGLGHYYTQESIASLARSIVSKVIGE